MVQSGTNFNNNGGTQLYNEGRECWVRTERGVGTYWNGWGGSPKGYELLCTITYDRFKHSARIHWVATNRIPSPSPAPAPIIHNLEPPPPKP